jgi:hypothetical protein
VDEAEQDVLGPDVVVGEHAGLFLGQHDHPAGSVREPLEHAYLLESSCGVAQDNPTTSLRVPATDTPGIRYERTSSRSPGRKHETEQSDLRAKPARARAIGQVPAMDREASRSEASWPSWALAEICAG